MIFMLDGFSYPWLRSFAKKISDINLYNSPSLLLELRPLSIKAVMNY